MPELLSIQIIDIQGTGNETEAIRQVLEYYGARVSRTLIGRPRHLLQALHNCDPGHLILCCHGSGGKIMMPELAEEIYDASEPKGDIAPDELAKHPLRLPKLILTTGCELATEGWSDLWFQSGAHEYIAPGSEIDGNTMLQFVLHFYFEVLVQKKSTADAHQGAQQIAEHANHIFLIPSKRL